MARSTWMLFRVVLVVVSAAMMGAAAVGEKEERVALAVVLEMLEGGPWGRGAETGGAKMEATRGDVGRGDDRGVGHRDRLEEGEVSGIGGGEDSTFQDLPELSSGSRPSRLRQSTIFELLEVERGRRRQSGEGTSAPSVEEEEELGSNNEEDADFDMEAEPSGEEDEEEQEAREEETGEQKAEEQPAQVHRGAKRRRIHNGVGIAGWSTLLGDGLLEDYRCRPTAMQCFRTICGGQVHTGGLK